MLRYSKRLPGRFFCFEFDARPSSFSSLRLQGKLAPFTPPCCWTSTCCARLRMPLSRSRSLSRITRATPAPRAFGCADSALGSVVSGGYVADLQASAPVTPPPPPVAFVGAGHIVVMAIGFRGGSSGIDWNACPSTSLSLRLRCKLAPVSSPCAIPHPSPLRFDGFLGARRCDWFLPAASSASSAFGCADSALDPACVAAVLSVTGGGRALIVTAARYARRRHCCK